MRVVICGGGVIGTTLACFLARRGAEAVVVESTGLACAASGKSGGFLARDWCDGTPLELLARRSFALHADLADELGGAAWGYRRVTTYAGFADVAGAGAPAGPGWVGPGVRAAQRIGDPDSTAQVHPARFTEAMMRAAQDDGASLRPGRVTGLLRSGEAVRGVALVDGTLEADAVVVAMGPWSVQAAGWLPLPAVSGLKGHSLVFEAALPAESLFIDYREADGGVESPEVFPRPDGTTYVCAVSSSAPLPADPAAVAPDPGALERLAAICRDVAPALGRARILAGQACHRPVTADGLPLLGRVPGAPGAFVATGHSVWGILNAPATAEAMAGLILGEAAGPVDLAPFDPARLQPLDPHRLAGRR